jgi:hypothetical protein
MGKGNLNSRFLAGSTAEIGAEVGVTAETGADVGVRPVITGVGGSELEPGTTNEIFSNSDEMESCGWWWRNR